ncbi:6697_t:CDS:1, partial [Acaulospora morrowiae]
YDVIKHKKGVAISDAILEIFTSARIKTRYPKHNGEVNTEEEENSDGVGPSGTKE